ncbi:MAG: lipase family protein [Bacteroidota bacterium]
MQFKSTLIALATLIVCSNSLYAQELKPGFEKNEYIKLLEASSRFADSSYYKDIPFPEGYQFIYQSPEMGLDNRWSLWLANKQTAVISLRGTTEKSESWLANFYAAMVPASGSLHISDSFIFDYDLATDPKAAVHVGWLLSTAFLAKDILPKLDSCYSAGIKNFLISGHSQGGAISYLLTAYLYNLQQQGKIPTDIRFKTYCSAAPKPGNVYFAYQYEAMTQNGWSFNVVNSADWVPEVPFTVQTLCDLNTTNPFINAGELIKKQGFPKSWVISYIYNKLSNPSIRAQKNYQKYLGNFSSKMVQKYLPGYQPPAFYCSSDYVRTGTTIVLLADAEYFKKFPDNPETIFVHHLHKPYLFLAEKLKD